MSRVARRRLGDIAVVLISLAFAVVLGFLVHQVGVMRQQITALSSAYGDSQTQIEDLGGDPSGPPAEELLEDPEYTPQPGPQGETGPGPSDDQVYAAVEAYFRLHPVEDGEDASPAMIAAAVINYLTEHPPAPGDPGPAPTADQILGAVGTYLAANPPASGPQGPAGADGEDGHTPTSEEIQAELAAYLEAHPIEMCDPGWESTVLTVLTVGPPTEITTCARQEEN